MATSIFFEGKQYLIPGPYSTIKSGIKNPALALNYGNVLVIDTGTGKFFGGGSGVNGTLKQGRDSIYTFDNTRDFRTFVRGGLWWLLGGPIFTPGGGATAGASSLSYVRAATTVPAELTLLFGATDDSDSDLDTTNDGQVTLQVKDEGYVGNAVFGDETRAQATITVTNAGVAGNEISLTVDAESAGTYIVQTGDSIQNVVTGFAAAITASGFCSVISTSATQIVIYAPRGYADDLNGLSPVIGGTGSVAGTTSTFSGGVEGTKLTRGYGAKVIVGVIDTDKFIVQFFRGTFKGTDEAISSGTPFDNIAELSTKPELIAQSPEISTVQELVTWLQDTTGKGYVVNQYFSLLNYTVAATDEILPQDITDFCVKAIGGTESSSITDLNNVLDSLEGNYDFILADNWEGNARSSYNLAIFDWIVNTAKIKPDLYIAGYDTVGGFNTSVGLAQAYDSMHVTIVHGGPKKIDIGGRSFKDYDAIYKAAVILGREAGLPPQVPLTFKGIGIEGEQHSLKDKEVNTGLEAGVLMSRLDNGSFEIIKGVNTLQNNSYLVNPDGTTHSKQLARVIRQINKEIIVNAKQQLLKKPNGVNRNTLSPEDVKSWTEAYLQSKCANQTQDNLILSFQNVDVTVSGDAYNITYAFVPNFEVSFLVWTGTIIDPQ